MSAGHTLHAFRPGIDDAEVLRLRAEVWGSDHPHGNPAFFDWLFTRHACGRGSGTLLRRDGQLIGFAGLVPRRLRVGQALYPVAHGLDYMVHPGHRGSSGGLPALQIALDWSRRARAGGHAFSVNFPNSASAGLLTSRRLKWRPILTPRLLVRPLPRLRFDEPLGPLPPWLATAGGRTLGLMLSPWPRARLPDGYTLVDVARFDSRFDALWADASTPGGAAFVRDAAYLNWRYVGHPVYGYRIRAVEAGGVVKAMMVASPRRLLGLDSLLIVDALAAADEQGLLRVLAEDCVHHAGSSAMGIVGAQAAPGSSFETALRNARFSPVPERFNPKPFKLIGLSLAADLATLPSNDWHLTWGDMDVV